MSDERTSKKWGSSQPCKDGEHGWCMNRSPEECHCTCECHAKQSSKELVEQLHALGDKAYCDMIRLAERPESLGWEAKVRSGKFGNAELDAHRRGGELYGKHLAFREAERLLRAADEPLTVDPLPDETRAATSRGAHSTEDAGRPGPSTAQPRADLDAKAQAAFEKQSANWTSVTPWHELAEETRQHWRDYVTRAAKPPSEAQVWKCPDCGDETDSPPCFNCSNKQQFAAGYAAGVHGLKDRADAWSAIARKLEEINPHTFKGRQTGLQCALDQIDRMRTAQPPDAECICKGNWRLIVKESEGEIGQTFTDHEGKEFSFFGIVHGGDDYYYGMYRRGDLRLLSCVGSLETHGYSAVTKFEGR